MAIQNISRLIGDGGHDKPGGGGGGGGGAGGGGGGTGGGTGGGGGGTAISGTSGDDTLNGTSGDDTLSGLGGNDRISGAAGADTIDGGDGDDFLYSDLISPPESTTPALDHGVEVDSIIAGDGSDIIYAGYGDNVDGGADGYYGDTLHISFQGASTGVQFDGHLATQTIGGGTITGIENLGWVEGSNYDDHLDLGMDSNTGYVLSPQQVYGLSGNDTIVAGAFTSVLNGGDGNDVLDARNSKYLADASGGAGDDVIYGSANDYSIVEGGDGNDTIIAQGQVHAGAGNDVIHALSPAFDNDISGDAGNDTIYGSDANDNLDGGAGDDILTGGGGSDLFVVGDGSDTITDFSAGDRLAIGNSFSADSVKQVGSDVVITFDDQHQLTFKNMDVAGVEDAIQSSVHSNDAAISADGSTIYTAGDDGTLYVYSGVTGEFARAWHVGTSLGGMDISPDGSFAVVTDLQPIENGSVSGYSTYTMAVHEVDLATGAVTTFDYQSSDFAEYSFYDAAVLRNGEVLLAEQMPPGWSGFSATQVLDLQTGEFTLVPLESATSQVLSDSPDGSTALILPEGISDAPLFLYQQGSGIVASHTMYADHISGDNTGVQAYNQQAGLVAQGLGSEINIYNAQLEYQFDLGQVDPQLTAGGIAGLAFDSSGQSLFVLNVQDNAIYQVSTSDWSVLGEFAVGTDIASTDGGFGNRLLVSPDMSYFTVLGDDGALIRVDVNGPPQPTDGNDMLIGTAAADTIDGLGGDDVIKGLAGSDTLDGSAGDDTIAGGGDSDTIAGGEGNDTIYTADALGIDNGSEHDAVTGGGGNDFIWAGYGDTVDGGLGTDTLHLNLAGATSGVTLDTAALGSGMTIGGGTIANIEIFSDLVGSDFADTLTLGSYRLAIDAAAGDDTIVSTGARATIAGGSGNDVIDSSGFETDIRGGDGADTIKASAYGDYIFGGAGDDSITFSGATGMIYAEDGDDHVVLNTSGISASGGLGDDTFVSAGGNSLDGGGGSDTVDYSQATGPVTVDLHDGAGANGDFLDGIENVTGSTFADIVTGAEGTNALDGGIGNDTLQGGAGADTLTGGTGNDTFLYSSGDGTDTITDFASGDIVRIDGYGSAQSLTQDGSNVLIVFGAGDQITFENTTTAVVQAGLDFGAATGNGLTGTSGPDALRGGTGDDFIYGLEGDDTLIGDAGDDTLRGGLGADALTGDAGADIFQFEADNGNDSVTDFVSGTDSLDFHLLGITSADIRSSFNHGNTLLRVDGDHDGRVDFSITLVGAAHVDPGDFIFS